ncbi:hypothetical protein WJ0W_000395 [Paenibacillus melissococcoides]|uniref:VOC domain-containing protein n=1 Tax=Paenibacillus melissococcoides TaxID=2912268 RepID=A0ABM9FVJ1_9BACL|nr:hypothetical protein [Paenibacillus melissococcoides]GIO77213.1 hypothetical protein J6TS7_08230 [Paenibacillus dendritiformis]CAH8243168.1 hypothetical protein WJ0W_000395 [Paenibacillus melissococcoides]CAH8703887.1 hypothetical protein WDD9_000388 [Paenibacillus melissococcoides]CAH8706984.1 hypothetical protein HTL2_001472 [Paenibacillus melissococcoides]
MSCSNESIRCLYGCLIWMEAAHRQLQAAGVEVSAVEEEPDVRWFSFEDHCGNRLEECSF